MNRRIVTWGSFALAIGGVVCAVVASRTQGALSTALWAIGSVLMLIGIVGLVFSEKYVQKDCAEQMAQDEAEQRDVLNRAKYLQLLYTGKKKRLGAPTEKDHFIFEAYLSEDRAEVESYLDDSMPVQTHVFIAKVVEDAHDGHVLVEMRNRFKLGDTLEVLSADDNFLKQFSVREIISSTGQHIDDAKRVQERVTINCPYSLRAGDILRTEKAD